MPVLGNHLFNGGQNGPLLNQMRGYVGNWHYLPPDLSTGTYGGDAFRAQKARLEGLLAPVNDEYTARLIVATEMANPPNDQGPASVDGFMRCCYLYMAGVNAVYGEPVAEEPALFEGGL